MKISVKELAEFVHRRGDIHYRYRSATLAEEGIARQKAWQRDRQESYRREHPVAGNFGDLAISGRVDGWDPAARLVEEIKTTRADAKSLHEQVGSMHWAQLRLYGALLVLGDHLSETSAGEPSAVDAQLRLHLIYLHPEDSAATTTLAENWSADDLIAFFETTCGCYAAWLANTRRRLLERDRRLRALPFPYPTFRPDQRRLAKHIYRGLRDNVHWLIEAPTGSGKTMTSLFPALKAIGEGELDRLVFATARGTGQVAAEDAIADATANWAGERHREDGESESAAPAPLREAQGRDGLAATEGGSPLLTITITAKERICFNPGTPCDPRRCQYASGYYDRLPAARRELLAGGQLRRRKIEEVARRHQVCPFELSLDTAAWADILVCDYNYVFDPLVRLKRIDNGTFARVGLIVDEAHQLGERTRAMLSAKLPRALVKAALREANLPASAAKLFRSVDRALATVAKAAKNEEGATQPGGASDDDSERMLDRPETLCRALERLAVNLPQMNISLEDCGSAAEAYWHSLRFHRALAWAKDGAFHYLAHGTGKTFEIELVCTLPGGHITDVLATFQGSVRLSGTLTPSAVFQRIHGFAEDAPFLRSEGCFAPDRLGVFVVPDLSTYYRDRSRTLPALAALIASVRAATPGNCLVAFPSFEYLEAIASQQDHADVRCQTRAMDLQEREDFVWWLGETGETRRGVEGGGGRGAAGREEGGEEGGEEDRENRLRPSASKPGRLGLVVMGGLFAESVDFDSRAVRAVIVVGPSLPPRSMHLDLIARDSASDGRDGHEIAYRQPAMTRVAQVVGRVARDDQRGVAVLVDPRFGNAAYRAFLPPWWRLRTVPSARAGAVVERFWQDAHQFSEPTSPLNGPTSSAVIQPP